MDISYNLLASKLDEIECKLDYLIQKIDTDVVDECKKMGNHIDFVDTIYDKVKTPLNTICEYMGAKTLAISAMPVDISNNNVEHYPIIEYA